MLQQHRQRSFEHDSYVSTRARVSHQVLDVPQFLERLCGDRELHFVSRRRERLDERRCHLRFGGYWCRQLIGGP
jgi:hypothetical protein